MKNYSLSIYQITINKRFNKDEKVYLSDYDNGKDVARKFARHIFR